MTLQTPQHNPAYAGIYAYGRRRVDPRRKDSARPSTGRVVQARDEWLVMIPTSCPPTSRSRSSRPTRRNWPRIGPAPRRWTRSVTAPALAAGLVFCGRCQRRMTVRHHTQNGHNLPEYMCVREVTNYDMDKTCQLLNAACVDAFVEQQVLAALTPAAVEVSLHAADQVVAERAELEKV